MRRFVLIMLRIALLSVVAIPQAEAMPLLPPVPLIFMPPDCGQESLGEMESKLQMLRTEKQRRLTVNRQLREEMDRAVREQREPDIKKTRDVLSTATGQRGRGYYERPQYIRDMVDSFDALTPYNVFDAFDLAQKTARMGIARAHYENEIERNNVFIEILEGDEQLILRCLRLSYAMRPNSQPTCPANALAGGYLVACDPGMGDAPPFISDAMQSGQGFQRGAPWGSDQQPPTGPTEPGQPQPPTYTGAEPPPGPQPPGYPPYQCGYPGYPPCPPGYSPPYDPSGKPPWEALIPPSEPGKPKPPTGGSGGPCLPPCHIKPGTNICHCGGG